jgi:hypothetical protein
MTPAEQLIALLEEAPRLSLFVRHEVRFDKFDAYELVTAIRNDGPAPRLAEAADAVEDAVRNARPVPLTDQVRIPRDQVGELVTALRAAGE